MNPAQEESADHLDESNANSTASVDQSLDHKGNGPREHAKPRRRRRGKKRKQKKESAATCEAENPDECENELHAEIEHEIHDDSEYHVWDSDENLSCEAGTFSDIILRPIDVPKAPLNSTQFIIDDHNDCTFYLSFETPEDEVKGDCGHDAAYIDIDYQYESPQDRFDNTAYYDKEFELSYKNSRIEECQSLSRADLIVRLQTLEARCKELTEDLVKENPETLLEKLQADLLELQEKNSYLKESNSKLTVVLQNEAGCSEMLGCQTVTESVAVSSISHEHESENDENESGREVYEECSEVCGKNCDSQISQNETEDERLIDNRAVDDCSIDFSDLNEDHHTDHSEVGRVVHHIDDSEVDRDNQMEHGEVCDQHVGNSEIIGNPQGDRDSWNVVREIYIGDKLQHGNVCSSTTITNSEGIQMKHIHSNSRKMLHCQPNNRVNDDLRTLNISSTELFHITNQTKCYSLVPVEGGMSPSETSVN